MLGPGGEFAFVVIGAAMALSLVDNRVGSFTLAVTSLTMALIPLLSLVARRLNASLAPPKQLDPQLLVAPPAASTTGRAIVVGYGHVGQVVCEMLERHRFPFLATDRDPSAVVEERRRGREVYYGDAANAAYLKSCGLMDAAALIVTIHDQAGIDAIVRLARELRPDILVHRARPRRHARAPSL